MNSSLHLLVSGFDFLAPSTIDKAMIGVFFGCIALEWIVLLALKKPWSNGDAARNIVSTFVGMAINAVVGGFFAFGYLWAYHHISLFHVPGSVLGWVYVFLVVEFVLFAQHYAYHRIGIFWALHSVHHSSEDMNVPVASRSFWGMSLFVPIEMIVLPVLGIGIAQLGMINLARALWQYPVHSKAIPKLGPLEHIINTPSNHRVHHGRQLKYLDRNFSEGFLLFDKVFGTHQREEEEPEYGIVGQPDDRRLLAFQTAGLRHLLGLIRSAPKLKDKLAYLYMPPGWRHTGGHLTVEAIRRSQRAQQQPVFVLNEAVRSPLVE